MTKTLRERRESSIVTLDDAIRLIWRASKSKIEIIDEGSSDPNRYVVPVLDSDLFKAFLENFRVEISYVTEFAGIAAINDFRREKVDQHYGTHDLLEALYSPGGSVSRALQTATLHEHDWMTRFFDVRSKGIFWQCIDYLRKIDHPARFDTLINEHARTNIRTFEGLKVRDAFYTAAYRDGWNYGEPRQSIDVPGHLFVNTAPNHAEAYIVGGHNLGLDEPRVLIRTGNGIAGIKPVVRAVDKRGKVGGYAAYQTRGLSEEVSEKISRKLGLDEEYKRIEEMAKH